MDLVYVSICLSWCWLQLWLKGHIPPSWFPIWCPLVPNSYTPLLCLNHNMCSMFHTFCCQFWCYMYLAIPCFLSILIRHIFLEIHTRAFLLPVLPSVTDSVVHTIGFMPPHLEQCVRHALILLLSQYSFNNIHELWRFRTSLGHKTNRCNRYIHWIQQQQPISIGEVIKSALHCRNPSQ